MGGELDRDPVVDIGPIRMVTAGFGKKRDTAHEPECFNKTLEQKGARQLI